jgi:hypothetical protein
MRHRGEKFSGEDVASVWQKEWKLRRSRCCRDVSFAMLHVRSCQEVTKCDGAGCYHWVWTRFIWYLRSWWKGVTTILVRATNSHPIRVEVNAAFLLLCTLHSFYQTLTTSQAFSPSTIQLPLPLLTEHPLPPLLSELFALLSLRGGLRGGSMWRMQRKPQHGL